MNIDTLTARLEQLEAREAIRALKHRYLACCDAKDPQGFRACFVDGPVAIDYGPIGRFDSADDLVAVFEQIACHPHMLEWHLASNDRIELQSAENARGWWSMHYQLINTQEQTLTQLGGEYEDTYRRGPDGWKISGTRFTPRSQLVLQLDAAAVRTLAAGPPPAA